MKSLSFLTAAATFFVIMGTSCKETNNYNDNDDRTVIRLSSSVELGSLRLQDAQIAPGQELSFFVTRTDDQDVVLYDNVQIIANGQGGFTSSTMYYPADGGNVDFYGVHPYSEDAEMGEDVQFTIEADQSLASGYLNSDFLYATRTNVRQTTAPVGMTFYHKMAKLDFVIIQGESADISDLAEVTTLNVRPTTTINVGTGNQGAVTGTGIEVISYGVNDANSEVPGRISGITAIVVPQTIPAGRLFRIRIGDFDYYYNSNAPQEFEAGKKYTLNLTIRQATVSLTSTVADWTDGGTIIGDGTID